MPTSTQVLITRGMTNKARGERQQLSSPVTAERGERVPQVPVPRNEALPRPKRAVASLHTSAFPLLCPPTKPWVHW